MHADAINFTQKPQTVYFQLQADKSDMAKSKTMQVKLKWIPSSKKEKKILAHGCVLTETTNNYPN